MFRVRIGGEPNPPLTQTLINDSAQKAPSKSIYLCFRGGSGRQKFLSLSVPAAACRALLHVTDYATI
jgi:hypothetical protein